MKELSKAVENAPKSKIRKLFDMAAGMKDVISLGIGQPDTLPPDSLIEGTIKALKERKTVYAPTRGVPELRQLIAEKVERENGIHAEWDKNIIISNGGSQAITLAFAVVLNPGDEILVASPNFVSYFYCSTFFGAKAVEIPRNDDYSPNFDLMESSITDRTKAIIVCSPNNPTGYVFTEEDWKRLSKIVIDNDLYLISDEPYEKFVYDGYRAFSPASMEGMMERTITLNAISKTFSAPGFRLGYVVADERIINLMEKYMQYTVAGVNHPVQYGVISALKANDVDFNKQRELFQERRDIVFERLNKMGLKFSKPHGSFYVMPSLEAVDMNADDFAMKLLEQKGVAVVPGDIFGAYSKDKIRISYALDKSKLIEAMDRIEDFISKL